MTSFSPKSSASKCSRCGSPLIFVSRKDEVMEGSKFPMTVSVYRCSNPSCQKEIDKNTRDRIALRKNQEKAKLERSKKTAS